MAPFRSLTLALLLAASPALAQQPAREQLTIGITQDPATLHPNIESMAAKSYVLGFTRRVLTTYGQDWALACRLLGLPPVEGIADAAELGPGDVLLLAAPLPPALLAAARARGVRVLPLAEAGTLPVDAAGLRRMLAAR